MSKKVLFIHDGPMGIYNNQTYGTSYKNSLVERYSFFGNKVSFLMRSVPLNETDLSKYSKIDAPDFNFISIPNFKSLKTKHKTGEAKAIIHKAVREHDIFVLRFPSAAAVIAFKEAKRLGKPVLVEFVACVYDALWNYDWRGKILAKYKFKQYQKLMQAATHTVYVTNKFLQSRYPSPGKSIGCSDVELQKVDDTILAVRLEHIETHKGSLKLATIAAIDVTYKAQADVIEAIAELKKKGIYFKYDIIGQGNPVVLQNLIDSLNLNDLVHIKGAVPHDQIFEVLKTTDIYMQPSLVEGLPRAVVEAMSVGCPVIGSNAGGIPELIAPGCTYPKGNIRALTNLLANVDQEFLSKQAKINFETAKDYQIGVLEKKRKDFYKEFLSDYHLL